VGYILLACVDLERVLLPRVKICITQIPPTLLSNQCFGALILFKCFFGPLFDYLLDDNFYHFSLSIIKRFNESILIFKLIIN
jgi:hypothetical protein